ncbi:MAG: BMP family ABC transporter substrate-binding protein [Candidatus Baldrarchaeia archaeon]
MKKVLNRSIALSFAFYVLLLFPIVIAAASAGTAYATKISNVQIPANYEQMVLMQRAKVYSEIVTLTQFSTIRAGFIYVGPIGDYGWTHAHDRGRKIVDDKYNWLETVYVESVSEDKCYDVIRQLVEVNKCNVIFTTSFGFMDPTLEAAKYYYDELGWRNVTFFHCSGFKNYTNMGNYFAEFYQIYYLNGLMAGALTKTGKAGYVAAHLIPEVIRHINAFALGFKEVAMQRGFKNPTVYVMKIGKWYDPDKARELAKILVEEYGCDVLAFTEDSPAVIQYCQKLFEETGKLVYTFAHYSPMLKYGPNVTVSGQLAHWEVIYEDILVKIHEGKLTPNNISNLPPFYYWWRLGEGAVELGCDYGVMINPIFLDDLKSITVKDKLTNETVSAYELIMRRLNAMNKTKPDFDPFTGPIKAANGTIVIKEGEVLPEKDLWALYFGMNWFVEGVVVIEEKPAPFAWEWWMIALIAVAVIVVVIVLVSLARRRRP